MENVDGPAMFAGAELSFQPSGDDGGALEVSLIEV